MFKTFCYFHTYHCFAFNTYIFQFSNTSIKTESSNVWIPNATICVYKDSNKIHQLYKSYAKRKKAYMVTTKSMKRYQKVIQRNKLGALGLCTEKPVQVNKNLRSFQQFWCFEIVRDGNQFSTLRATKFDRVLRLGWM